MFELEPLPYPPNALVPYMSMRTVVAHRVLQGRYLRNVNDMVGARYVRAGARTLQQTLELAAVRGDNEVYEQASQAWNHAFWWRSLCPAERFREPQGALHQAVLGLYGGYGAFVGAAQAAARRLFGSGWLWLALIDGAPRWVCAPNAERPVRVPLLVVDLWEHSYWLDHPAQKVVGPPSRETYLTCVLHYLANWEFAQERFAEAMG